MQVGVDQDYAQSSQFTILIEFMLVQWQSCKYCHSAARVSKNLHSFIERLYELS
jgi:hypothetical protein